MLVVYRSPWFPVFFSGDYHGATPICSGTNRYGTDDASFDIFPKGFLYLLLVVIWYWNINRMTCLAPDWSKDGMGFLLLQKHCTCPTEKAPVCCPDGWHIVFAGSRFCTDAERRYAPIEGEAAAIACSLEKCRLFIIGCPNVIVVTDHQPLTGIFGDRDLGKKKQPKRHLVCWTSGKCCCSYCHYYCCCILLPSTC